MKKNKSLIKHYNFLGFEFDSFDLKIILTILLGFISILLLFLFPFKTYALEQNDKYFNLEFPDSFHNDLTDIKFGGNTDLYDFSDSLINLQENYRNITFNYNYNSNGSFARLYLFLCYKNITSSVVVYGSTSSNNSNLTINNNLTFSSPCIRYSFAPSDDETSILNSNSFSSIKNCVENGICPTSKPTETDYNGSISFASGSSNNNNSSYVINNFDSSLDYNIKNYNLIYYSSVPLTLVDVNPGDYVSRNIKYNYMELEKYKPFPSYLDYINQPDEPVTPDDPLDTNVGVWKNWVYWFVDNNTEYGVLVNIYLLLFISIIFISIICFLKIIKKTRW